MQQIHFHPCPQHDFREAKRLYLSGYQEKRGSINGIESMPHVVGVLFFIFLIVIGV